MARGRMGTAALGVLLLTLAAVVVVATWAGPGGPQAPPATIVAATALARASLILLAAAAVVICGLLAWALWGVGRRPAMNDKGNLRRYFLISVVQALIVLLILWWRPELQRALLKHAPNQQALGGAIPPLPAGGSLPAPPGVDWLTAAIVFVALLAFGYFSLGGLRGRARRTPREATLAAVQAAVEESLDDLDDEDLRRAVIRAYARMEAALASAGLPRRHSETSLEYMTRALAWLGAGAAEVRRLTELFNLARFSPHPVDAGMRSQAFEALDGLRRDLGARATGRAA